MWQVGVSLVVAFVGYLLYLRIVPERDATGRGVMLRHIASRPEPTPATPWVVISTSLCGSLTSPAAQQSTRFAALASPRDACVLAAERGLFEIDVNARISSGIAADRPQIETPIHIVRVISDEDVEDGEPKLVALTTARLHELCRGMHTGNSG